MNVVNTCNFCKVHRISQTLFTSIEMTPSVDRFISRIEKGVQAKYIPFIKAAILGADKELYELLAQIPGSPVSH